MDDLDGLLGGFGMAGHPRLDGMESRLLARIEDKRRGAGDLPRALPLGMVAVALGIGLMSGQAAIGRETGATIALDSGLALAPSARLASSR